MNSVVEDLLEKLKLCSDNKDRCDYLLDHAEITYLLEYIKELQDENVRLRIETSACETVLNELEKRVNAEIDNIDLVIELIKQQPTGNDSWILDRLNGFKIILQGKKDE